MRTLCEALEPAVRAARNEAGDAVENAACRNVTLQIERLRRAQPTLSELCETRRLQIVGAIYDIGTGAVDWLPE
jgi:carbonic anhydrase